MKRTRDFETLHDTLQDTRRLLQEALEKGIINMDDVRECMNKQERKEILNKHPFDIWEASDGRFKTYIEDDTKASKRKLIAKNTKAEVEDVIVKDYKKKHPVKKKDISVEAIFKEWIEYALINKDIEKNTADRYQNDFDKFLKDTAFAKMDIEFVTSNDVTRFLKQTVNDHFITRKAFSNLKTLLKGIFGYAMTEAELECISITYVLQDLKISDKKFKKVIVRDEEQVYTEEEVLQIAEHILKNYTSTRELGVLLAFLTGVRNGELSTLKAKDQENDMLCIQRTEIKYKNAYGKTVYDVREFPKSEASMDRIELSDSAIKVLALIRKHNLKNGVTSEYLFYEEEYGRLKSYFFSKALKNVCKAIGIPYRSMHKCRKTYASYLLANGVEEKIAQAQMRHKDSATTHKYYEFSIRAKQYKKDVLNQNDILSNVKII